jgi:diguanylate cyclase (GGDEF)-like protein
VLTVLLIVLLALATGGAVVAAALLARRTRRLHAAEDAVVLLARSWSEDGSSRGRLCAAAQQVAGAELAFLAEPTRRDDGLVITATAQASELAGARVPLDAERSLLARCFLTGTPIELRDVRDAPDISQAVLTRAGAAAAHLRPIFRGNHVVGVLVVGWASTELALAHPQAEIVDALAGEAARAIERDAHVALLNRQARTDDLTALPNRRAWDEAVEREIARGQRTGDPLCVALLDLDHFKAYNDAHGHQAGDAHLRRTATAWRRELRAIDVLARYGGEEFGVLLPQCDPDRAREVIDRVRSVTPNDQTASAGVVLFDGKESADSLLARADAALYRAKHAGRAVTVPA